LSVSLRHLFDIADEVSLGIASNPS
jgi:hypothetical protein